MKKIFLLMFVGLIMALTFVSADCQIPIQNATSVSGTIYIQGTNTTVSDADVTVICNNGAVNITKLDVSDSLGAYAVLFDTTTDLASCGDGSQLTVTAAKDSMNGLVFRTVGSGTDLGCVKLNVEVADVPLVPEFTLLIGGITLIGALVAFMIIRRK